LTQIKSHYLGGKFVHEVRSRTVPNGYVARKPRFSDLLIRRRLRISKQSVGCQRLVVALTPIRDVAKENVVELRSY
jgi:hypothetical protein